MSDAEGKLLARVGPAAVTRDCARLDPRFRLRELKAVARCAHALGIKT